MFQRLAIVERAGEDRARLEQEVLVLLGALVVLDVGRRPDPLDDLAVRAAKRERPAEVPAIDPVGPPEAVLDLERLASCERLLSAADGVRQVVGVDDARPRGRVRLELRHPRVLEPAPVEVRRAPVGPRRPDDLRHRVREAAVAFLTLSAQVGEVLLAQQLALAPQLLVLLVQLDEDRDLRAQDLGIERLEEIVDGAGRVAPEDVARVLADRGEEDDRDRARALPLLDQLRRLEAVEVRHLDVEEDHGEVVAQQLPERVLTRMRPHEVLAERLEDRLEREQVLGRVVDEQQVGRALSHASPRPVSGCRARRRRGRSRRAAARRRPPSPRARPTASRDAPRNRVPARLRRRRAA